MGRLDESVALTTGGASGIGQATVRLFVEEGAQVMIADILDEEGSALAEELGGRAMYQHTDVGREPDVAAAVDRTVAEFGRLDCVFNNAGGSRGMNPIDETPLDNFEFHMGVLLRGVFLGVKHAARVMKVRGSGSIVNTASIAGLQTGWGALPYSTAKAAVIHLTRCAAVELGESGVRVNCICPGAIATPIFARAFGMSQTEAVDKLPIVEQAFEGIQPVREAGKPEDIANAVVWLASDDSSFMNGHAMVIDGGLTCGRGYTDSLETFGRLAAALAE